MLVLEPEGILIFDLDSAIEDGSMETFNYIFIIIIFLCLASIFYYFFNIFIDFRVGKFDTNMLKLHHMIYVTCPVQCFICMVQQILIISRNSAASDPSNSLFQVIYLSRITSIFPGLLCLSAFVIERFCATWYLSDYEINRRSWIGYTIGVSIFTISGVMALTLAQSPTPVYHVSIMIVLNVASCAGNVLNFCVNRRAYVKGQEGSYSLTERYQISENIQFYFFFNRFATSISFFTILCPILMLLHAQNFTSFTKNVIICAFDIAITCYTILTPYIVYKYNAAWQAQYQKFQQKWLSSDSRVDVLGDSHCGRSLRDTFGKEMNIDIRQQSETYFEQLASTWNHV